MNELYPLIKYISFAFLVSVAVGFLAAPIVFLFRFIIDYVKERFHEF